MSRKKPEDRRVVRTRRTVIYTFLLILIFMYISAHAQLEEERAQALQAETLETGNTAQDGLAAGQEENGEQVMEQEQEQGARKAESQEGLILNPEDMWCLILTNAQYPIPEDYLPVLKEVPGQGQSVDERIYDPLMEMLSDMKEQGLSPVVCSGYRTLDKQEMLFNRKVSAYVKQGYSMEEANQMARRLLSIPGSGEHCLGLAVDIYCESYRKLEAGFADTKEGKWLQEHCWDYGFILRYDQGKEELTGIDYEPWHFRYVGKAAAQYLKETGMCLEEFYIEESLYG